MNTKNLIKKHKLLLKNNNFLNNQNYVLWNYLESKIFNKYKKKNFIEKIEKKRMNSLWFFSIWLIFIFIWSFLKNYYILIIIWIIIIFIPSIFYWIYNKIKKFLLYYKYYLIKKKFLGNRYIFRKKINKRIKRNDYIIFNK